MRPRPCTSNPHMGVPPLAEAIDRFYTPDVFMHTWDLAAASGQELPEDQRSLDYAASLLAGMEEIEQMLRDSGQFGPRRPVDPDAGNSGPPGRLHRPHHLDPPTVIMQNCTTPP